jgi:FkbM family methyltransferase
MLSHLRKAVQRAVVERQVRRYGASAKFTAETVRITHSDGRVIVLSDRHRDYAEEMARHFDVYWGAVVDTHGVVDYSQPTLHKYRASGLQFWLPSMAEEPEAFASYLHWFRPGPGDVVFDLGAHSGVTTYHFAQLIGPTGRVYAFEPDPSTYELLLRNIALHDMKNVVAVPIAIGGENATRPFNVEGSLGAAFTDIVDRRGRMAVTDVQCLTLQTACAKFGIPALVKVDIEGAELEMLEAAVDFIRTTPMHLAVDTNHPVPQGGDITSSRVESLLRRAGYDTETSSRYGLPTTWGRPGA